MTHLDHLHAEMWANSPDLEARHLIRRAQLECLSCLLISWSEHRDALTRMAAELRKINPAETHRITGNLLFNHDTDLDALRQVSLLAAELEAELPPCPAPVQPAGEFADMDLPF